MLFRGMPEIWNWKVAARNREGWRKEIGEAVARIAIQLEQEE
jgi:hypothetical protein